MVSSKPIYLYFADGVVVREEWRDGITLHRGDDKPALIDYDHDGRVIREEWWAGGHRHRAGDNPAIITYSGSGDVSFAQIWHYGDLVAEMTCQSDLLTTEDVAELLQLSPYSLMVWRSRGQGPAYVKVGRLVRYKRADVEAWIHARRSQGGHVREGMPRSQGDESEA